ncbi:hypothetical protein HPP92_011387 [Vanilla planifolia]|uniref:Uncharacterized protein n=1 Tax=Vanilla planifolia TaxID=51239 RepID=A0A835RBE0_VANPL|nr:hypothetical protein HPP92_011672 [Vanilla planifolia]KAG0483303.1 hypothetical protein HPP92_011387 [Vanilla planifolia]
MKVQVVVQDGGRKGWGRRHAEAQEVTTRSRVIFYGQEAARSAVDDNLRGQPEKLGSSHIGSSEIHLSKFGFQF